MDFKFRRETVAATGCVLLLTAAWVIFAGKDVTWDWLNHQLYLPFSLLSGRFQTDLLAAGPQSYQNPLGYLPMYALVRTDLPGVVVGLILALTVTLAMAWAVFRIVGQVFGQDPQAREGRLLAVALSFIAPVHLLQIGGTSNDPLCAALILVALAIAMDGQADRTRVVVSGLVTGLAVAIKPTSLVFSLPTLIVVAMQVIGGKWTLRRAALGVLSATAMFAMAGGLWAGWLWQTFGNPTYPLLNTIFHSPLAPSGTTVSLRFMPQSLADWFIRPWQLIEFKAFVTVEAFAPDIRPAAALVVTIAAAAWSTVRQGLRASLRSLSWTRPDLQLLMFMAVAYLLWMATSGNARYAIAWFMLAGVVLVRSTMLLTNSRRALAVLAAVAGIQLFAYASEGDRRLSGRAWDSLPYAAFQIPARLVDEPVLHLSLGVQSHAGLAPFFHPAGAFVNLRGQMSLPNTGPLGELLGQQITRWKGRTRFLFAPKFPPGSAQFARSIEGDNWLLSARYGLRIDTGDCEVIRVRGKYPDAQAPSTEGAREAGEPTLDTVLSCAAVSDVRQDPDLDRAMAQADRVFAALEASCPLPFGPRPMITDANPASFWRIYMNSGAIIQVSTSEGVVVSYHRAHTPVYLGTIEQVLANSGKDACVAWKKLVS